MKDFPQFIKLLPDAEWRVTSPGRVNLLGEHVDYNQGIVLPAAIDRHVQMAAKARDDRLVDLKATDLDGSVVFSLDHLEERTDIHGLPLPVLALYPAGVAWSLQSGGLDVRGFSAVYQSDLPIGAGLSSSAAVELAFAALWQALGGWALDRMRLAQACQSAENHYVGVNCGLMDQFTCAHGIARHALLFDVRSLNW
ncbi:MAG TPA: galactokinase family protein [Pelolinea sp.]|nr:galactokinase family protein [Pelolinea sp.]